MKSVFLFFAFIASGLPVYGQGDYRPLLKEGKVWQEHISSSPDYKWVHTYSIDGDTLIDGEKYYKLYKQTSLYTITQMGAEPELETAYDIQYETALKEDAGRVYSYYNGNTSLLYDFNLKTGDIAFETNLSITSVTKVDTIIVGGNKYRRLWLTETYKSNSQVKYTGYWVEGIGSMYGIMTSHGWDAIPISLLDGCYEDGTLIFSAEDFNDLSNTKPVDNESYRPLVEEGKHWTVDDFMPLRPAEYDHYYYYDLKGDTLIAGKNCLKMYSDNLMNSSEIKYQGSLYEENKKVYCFSPGKEKAELLYDFDCAVGDTLHVQSGNLVVKDIQTEDNGGIAIKKYTLCEVNEMLDILWIEGVGASTDFFNMMPYPGNYSTLKACELNGEKLYQTIEPELTDKGYHKMGIEGKRWNYIHYHLEDDGWHEDPYSYVVKGDTVIRRTTYKKLYYQDEKTERFECLLFETGRTVYKNTDLGNNSYDSPVLNTFFEFDREDFGRVFTWKADMNAGNTNWMIYGVDTIEVKGQPFRRYTCLQKYSEEGEKLTTIDYDGEGVWRDIWVEGVGSATSGIEDQNPFHEPYVRTPGEYTAFVSCYEDGECIFTADDFNVQTADDNMAYHPFLKEGKTWNYQEYYHNLWDDEQWTKDVSYVIDGTTEIDGKTYYKMYRKSEKGSSYCCALREENRKVWMRTDDGDDRLLYDFGMSVGDSYKPYNEWITFQLVAISPMRFNDELLNVFHYDVTTDYFGNGETVNVYPYSIVEGVGCDMGWNILELFYEVPSNGIIIREDFLSCYEDDKCIFTADDFKDLTNTKESLYGEWWLVGWNDEGIYFEVDTNYVSHQHLSIEIPKEGYVKAYSMVNEIILGLLTLNGNEMIFGGERGMTKVYGNITENMFFEDHIFGIKSYQIEGNLLKLYYTDSDYFVFTSDFDNSEEHFYEWKNGPADPYIGEVTAMSNVEVEVKTINSPSYAIYYSRTVPPTSNHEICHFAMSDLADQSFEVGDKIAFRIVQFKKLKVEKGWEYELKVESCKGSGKVTDKTGTMHNDRRMGWIIIDDEVSEVIDDEVSEGKTGTYYYPMKNLAEEYLAEGQRVRFSGELYSTWRMPWDSTGPCDCYYLSIDALASYGTEDDYRPFVEEGKVWKVGGKDSGNPVQRVDYYYFDGDTIINGKTCKQMMCQRYVNPDYPNYEYLSQLPSLSKVGAWYEEDKKVYTYDAINNHFKLMYDFSPDANDTLLIDYYYQCLIGPKQTGGLKGFKGVYRDIMCFGDGAPYYNTTWLEGVGGIDGPTRNIYDESAEYVSDFLMSCTVGDEVIYLNDEYEDGATPEVLNARKQQIDFTHTIKTRPKAPKRGESQQSLYGEYNALQLDLNLTPLDDAYLVRITDESDKAVYEKSVNAGNIVGLNIDISTYAEGRYTVTVENSEESFTGQFEAQMTRIRLGDVNGDRTVDVADISTVISMIANGVGTADVNGDGVTDVADISAIISIMAGQLSE